MANYIIVKYIRLSMEDSHSDSASIENQRILLDNHIQSMDKLDASVVEFVDNGYSGTNFERPAVQELLELVRSGQVQCIIVKDFSRFGRNALETGYFLERVFPLYGVRFIAVADGYDSAEYQEDTGGLMVSFKFLMAEYYSKDLSRKISSAAHERMKRGERLTKRCALGYFKSPDNKLELDEAVASTVRRAFALALEGHTTTKIATMLHREACPTVTEVRMGASTQNPACIWTATLVRDMLQDEVYIGTYVAGKTKGSQFGSKRRMAIPTADWIRIPNHHPAIISAETFALVQQLLQKTTKQKGVATAPGSVIATPLKGFVYCGCCGHKLQKAGKKYACAHTRCAPQAACHKMRVGIDSLEQAVYQALLDRASRIAPNAPSLQSSAEVQDTAEHLRTAQIALYEAFIDGELDAEQYKSQKASIEADLLKLGQRPVALSAPTKKPGHTLPEMARCVLESSVLTETMVKTLIEKIYFHPVKGVEIHWKDDDFGHILEKRA